MHMILVLVDVATPITVQEKKKASILNMTEKTTSTKLP